MPIVFGEVVQKRFSREKQMQENESLHPFILHRSTYWQPRQLGWFSSLSLPVQQEQPQTCFLLALHKILSNHALLLPGTLAETSISDDSDFIFFLKQSFLSIEEEPSSKLS